jgi:hypothetical protein
MANGEQVIGSEDGVDAKSAPSSVEGGESAPPKSGESSETRVRANAPENAEKRVNPSAPGETGTTPGTNGK